MKTTLIPTLVVVLTAFCYAITLPANDAAVKIAARFEGTKYTQSQVKLSYAIKTPTSLKFLNDILYIVWVELIPEGDTEMNGLTVDSVLQDFVVSKRGKVISKNIIRNGDIVKVTSGLTTRLAMVVQEGSTFSVIEAPQTFNTVIKKRKLSNFLSKAESVAYYRPSYKGEVQIE